MQPIRNVVIVGATSLATRLIDALSKEEDENLSVAAIFDDRDLLRLDDSLRDLTRGNLDAISAYVRSHPVDRILITLPMAQNPRVLKLLDDLRDTTASVYFVPDLFMADLIQARVDSIGTMPVLAVCDTPFHGINGAVKRFSDICLALPCLILVLPLMLVVAIAIAITSEGPVIFRQKRYGLDGKEIIVWKFRSMRMQPVDELVVKQASKDDSRVTAIGRWIRRTSIDELPQLFNVLQGSMSLVGPRPHAVAHNELYRSLVKGYMIRHKVKPGITGLAQVSGARGETKTVDQMERRIALDLEYLRTWSLQLDIAILLRTLRVAFTDPKAY